jgi:transcriptional antiterminator RfaH
MGTWYVVRTKPNREAAAAASIEAVGARPFLPRIFERVRAGLHMQTRHSPMFPGYLFVNLDLDALGKQVRYRPGVRDFVRAGGVPQRIADEVIQAIRGRLADDGVYRPPPRRYRPGDRLVIREGPLRGLEVIFERELSGLERAAVLLAELSLSARVVLPNALLRDV